jgi:hypothetical protein
MVMNQLVYFHDEVSVEEAIDNRGADREEVALPERVPHTVRSTMEELGYRTAVWYVEGKATMHYAMTLKGIQVRKINDHSA